MAIKAIPTLIAIAITLFIWFVLPVPAGVGENGWHLLALFVGTIAAIIGKALPLNAVSVIAVALVAISGVTVSADVKDPGGQAIKDALSYTKLHRYRPDESPAKTFTSTWRTSAPRDGFIRLSCIFLPHLILPEIQDDD